MRTLLLALITLAAAASAGCGAEPGAPADDVAVLVLDSPVQMDFVEGRAAGLRAADVAHGSLVARVLRSYCRARLVSVPVSDPDGGVSRGSYLEGLRNAVRRVERHPDDRTVVNISLSSPGPDAEEEALLARLTAAGGLVIAGAGNSDSGEPVYPAGYPGVVAVASATAEGKAPSSNYGRHVDIAASGDVTFIDYEFLPYEWLRLRTEADGTSFAAPRVAATVAYVMRARPGLSPDRAYRIVAESTRPIRDDYGRDGLLGVGLLDIHAAKSAVTPLYRFVHFVLPVCVWVVLGVVSAYLVVRHALVGVFLAVVIWLVALPAGVALALTLGQYLEFIGGGSTVTGLAVTGIFGAVFALAAMIQGWQLARAGVALAGPFAAFLVWCAVSPTESGGPVVGAIGVGLVAVGLSAVLELRARRRLALVRRLAASSAREAVPRMLRLYGRTFDRRVGRAVVEALGRAGGPDVVSFLLREKRFPEAATASLVDIARREPASLLVWLGGLAGMDAAQRRRLLDALWEARDASMLPYLRQSQRQDDSGRLRRLIERIEAERQAAEGADTQ